MDSQATMANVTRPLKQSRSEYSIASSSLACRGNSSDVTRREEMSSGSHGICRHNQMKNTVGGMGCDKLCKYYKMRLHKRNVARQRITGRHSVGKRTLSCKRQHLNSLSKIWLSCALLTTLTSGFLPGAGAGVLEQGERRSSYIHRRLGGRERREIQRDFLSILGLSHRPRPSGDPARGFQHDSAPLYMLGLYNTVSGFKDIFEERIREAPGTNYGPNYPQKRDSPSREDVRLSSRAASPPLDSNNYRSDVSYGRSVGPFSDRSPYDVHVATNAAWYRYSEAQSVFTNEVGILERVPSQHQDDFAEMHYDANDNGLRTNGLERNLLGDADVVMSFINTNRGSIDDDDEEVIRGLLKRHRAFYFDVDETPNDARLTAAKFRLYKDMSEGPIGNGTLRVNVYQAMLDNEKEFGLYLLGSRLVRGDQEGWLVFDVTSAVRDWLHSVTNNMGLRVAVETLEGRSINLNKAGIVGRRGESSKQAFLVGFLSQESEMIPNRLRHRIRRSAANRAREESADSDMDDEEAELEGEDPQIIFYDNDDAPLSNTAESFSDDDELDDYPDEEDLDEEDESVPDGHGAVDYRDQVYENGFDAGHSQEQRYRAPARRPRRGKGKKKTSTRRKGGKKTRQRYQSTEIRECHRDELYVSFQDLGWEGWIIAPTGYDAYRCMGECSFPLNSRMNATNHAIVQTLVHLLQPDKPKPCCTPTKLEAMSVLYYNDNNNVVFKKYKNMVVKTCGCH